MVDLRLEGTDGEYLILETADGVTHRLLIDESVRRAVRRETVSDDDAQRITPREIQLEVRAGVTIEELAQKTGASLAYIEKFAAPVVDELAHIVASALSVRITMAGDRYSETTQVEFGEVITNRLASMGVVQPVWTSRKTENNGWQIQCRYGDNQASWAFDPRKLLLSPENELAVQLGATGTLGETSVPKLRPVAPAVLQATEPTQVTPPAFSSTAGGSAPQAEQASAPYVKAGAEPSAPQRPLAAPTPLIPKKTDLAATAKANGSITEDLGKTAEFDGVVPFGRESATPAPASQDASDLANTADLLDALRKRRIERERDVITTNTGSIATVTDDDLGDSAPDEEDYSQETPESFAESDAPTEKIDVVVTEGAGLETEQEKPKPKRTSMPSWDEIVFNTRSDD